MELVGGADFPLLQPAARGDANHSPTRVATPSRARPNDTSTRRPVEPCDPASVDPTQQQQDILRNVFEQNVELHARLHDLRRQEEND